ncbi:hypothetical protein BDF19DRAFT_451891 [Syncephalis fuscata]|nr:hypothetical protein BDF19DRAFT_451891 [Syncephalis fuscata]
MRSLSSILVMSCALSLQLYGANQASAASISKCSVTMAASYPLKTPAMIIPSGRKLAVASPWEDTEKGCKSSYQLGSKSCLIECLPLSPSDAKNRIIDLQRKNQLSDYFEKNGHYCFMLLTPSK